MKRTSIWIHSDSNWNLGIFLIFLAFWVAWPLPDLLWQAEIPGPWRFHGVWLGSSLLAIAYYALYFTPKRYTVEPAKVTLRDGWLGRAKIFRWEGPANIYLRSFEDDKGRWWTVDLACGKPHYCLHRALDDEHDSRNLAIALARALQSDLVEQDETGEVRVPYEELDAPLPERLRRHPQLLLPLHPEPAGSGVEVRRGEGLLAFRWSHSLAQIAPYFLALLFFIFSLAAMPLFPGPLPPHYQDWRGGALQRSAYERVSLEANYDYFMLSGLFLTVVTALVVGHSVEIVASKQGVRQRTRLWGFTLKQVEIPLAELREIVARRGRNGAHLEFLSDHISLGGRLARFEVARWIASEAQHFYASP